MRKVYQLGELTRLKHESVYNILKRKERIKKIIGEDAWHGIYKEIANSIRKVFGFPYAVSVTYDGNIKDVIIVVIFEYKISDTQWFCCHYDKDKKKLYMEVEDNN